ncbi:MAG: hypothetical protein J2O47_00405 [Acidimicrobiaceae bacterium]|nr:hypothetical protein [Acidimicrobiaceae bacterium]
MRRKAISIVSLALAVGIGLTGLALAEHVQVGKLVVDFDGGFRPTTLPKKQYAPIDLWGRADISTVDGSLPPAPRHVVIDWDRNGLLTTKGLPRCRPSRLENTTTPAAMKACRPALVGTGFASGQVAFPDQAPFPASSKILIFNGTPIHGHPVALIHAYAYVPAPTTFVVPVIITKVHHGRYKYETTLDAPVIAGGYGVVTHFDFSVKRLWNFHGRRLSYISARCADGRLQATGSATFADGSSLSASAFRRCKSKG